MSLKKALVAYTDKLGNDVRRVLTIKTVVFEYEQQFIEVIYRSRPQDEGKAVLADDLLISHRIDIGGDLIDPTVFGMILAASDLIWQMAAEQPLIEIPVLDEERNRTYESKSMAELGKIVDA